MTTSPVVYEEMKDSPTEGRDENGWTAERRILVDWSDRFDYINETYGQGYPYASLTDFVARVFQTSSMGKQQVGEDPEHGKMVQYSKALIYVTYTTKQSEAEPDELFSESLEPNAEFLTIPHDNFQWDYRGNPVPLKKQEAPGFLIRGADYSIAIKSVKIISPGVFSLMGFVNHQPYSSWLLGWTFPTETLRYDGPTLSRVTTTDGTLGWSMTMRFSYKPQFVPGGAPDGGDKFAGWNHVYRAATGKFEPIFRGGEEHKQYPLGDFNAIQFTSVLD